MSSLENQMIKVIQDANSRNTQGYDTTAEVKRVEGKIAYVHIPGGIDETPVDMNIVSKVGDIVQVRIANGRGWITGNLTSPPTDNTVANIAINKADTAQLNIDINTESLAMTQNDLQNTQNSLKGTQKDLATTNETLSEFMESLYDLVYPVGTYYWTGDKDFDPNIKFSGKWVIVKKGFPMSEYIGHSYTPEGGNREFDIGQTGGQTGVYIEQRHLPAEPLGTEAGKEIYNEYSEIRIRGNTTTDQDSVIGVTGSFTRSQEVWKGNHAVFSATLKTNYKRDIISWTPQTHYHDILLNDVGKQWGIETLPPYFVARCWYRES